MARELPANGLETVAFDKREMRFIRLRPGVRHWAKQKFARRSRKAAKLQARLMMAS